MASNAEPLVSAQDFFDELLSAFNQHPRLDMVYRGYSSVFHNLLAFHTQYTTIKFSGTFAKASHLLKEHSASAELTSAVNGLRVRLRRFGNSGRADEPEENYRHDFEALCRLIALVHHCAVPPAMLQLFPPKRKRTRHAVLAHGKECLRMIVESWDRKYMYGTTDGESDDKLTVSYCHTMADSDTCSWAYIGEYLSAGCQLNLVRPRMIDGIVVPELIVFEPDYLMNISEVAACFQPYGATHLNHLMRKLQPAVTTEAILLGNLAGQLLDEEINSDDDSPVINSHDNNPATTARRTYADSVRRFFRSNAFSMVATDIGTTFHQKALSQKANIHQAFAELPSAVRGYDRSKVVLEPSFISPMLGLQGRVDLMQQDFRFLVEQKSGSSAFPTPRSATDAPRPQTSHYVQILLYMMVMRYNFRHIYERNKREFSCFLLYSKYPSSLCGVDFAPELMFQAMKMRNAMVHADRSYTDGGLAVLDSLTPDDLRQGAVSDRFWHTYIRPQIAQVLDPIHQASELERRYFHRMMAFVATEHMLAKVGIGQRDDNGQASIWLSTLEQKRQSGNIFTNLQLISPTPTHRGAVEDVTLAFADGTAPEEAPSLATESSISNFRKGDIVILYPHAPGTCPDACATMVMRGSIATIGEGTVTIRLRAPQSDARIFTDDPSALWAVEHDFMESTHAAQYRGLHSLLTTTRDRRDLLMMQRRPRHDSQRTLRLDHGEFNQLALRVKQARDLFLIIGPPGTGKTSYGMLTTLREELAEPSSAVLIAAYTNRAVDEICSKLVADRIDFIRIGSPMSAEEAYHPYLIDAKVDECPNIAALRTTIATARVVVGTTTAIAASPALFALKAFDLLIVDEASQILEPHLLPILTALHDGTPAVAKTVMIGDHKQLPAVVRQPADKSAVADPMLNSIGLTDCRLSLFERLLTLYRDDSHITHMLTRQGRMHHDIALFPSTHFYEGRLTEVPLPHQTTALPQPAPVNYDAPHTIDSTLRAIIAAHRLAFIAATPTGSADSPSDKVNPAEADIIARAVAATYRHDPAAFHPDRSVGVIVPYRNQIAAVRAALQRQAIPAICHITIDTVERYQGSQRDTIIYGFTIQKAYQLQFLTSNTFDDRGTLIDRKLNVAMTRARLRLILVGNPRLLAAAPVFQSLIQHTIATHAYFTVSDN